MDFLRFEHIFIQRIAFIKLKSLYKEELQSKRVRHISQKVLTNSLRRGNIEWKRINYLKFEETINFAEKYFSFFLISKYQLILSNA